MRHRVYGKHLSRNKNQRTALFKSLVRALLLNEQIQTTEMKAKAVKGLVDKIINQAKSPATRRLVSQFITDKNVVEKLVTDLVPRLSNRNSGYTSTVRLGVRPGDGASMVKMSLLTTEAKTVKATAAKKEASVVAPEVVEVSTEDAVESKPSKKTKKETKKS